MSATATRQSRLFSAVAAVIVGLIVFAGAWTVLDHDPAWQSELVVAILPSSADPTYEAVYYQSLSQGAIVHTMAEVIRTAPSPDYGNLVDVAITPEASVVTVSAVGPDKALAIRAVDDRFTAGDLAVQTLGVPYRLRALGTAADRVEFIDSPDGARAIVAFGGAIASALLVAAAIAWLRRELQR